MSSFMIHTDAENLENQGCRKATRKAGLTTRPPLQERTALGNVNGPRIQPSRTAKGQTGIYEKVFQKSVEVKPNPPSICIPDQPTTFAIYEDVPSVHLPATSQLASDLEKATAGFTQTNLQNECGIRESSVTYSDSPMVIESSYEDLEEDDVVSEEKRLLIEERQDFVICIPEYRKEIYSYLRQAEVKFRPKPDYMRKQADITHTMRSILVDWLVEVAEEYKLSRETLCLTVSCIDRFLSLMSVVRSKLQLVGAAAMFIAAKYEEVYPPEVQEFVYITDDTYTMKQVLQMEKLILKVLSFSITVPTVNGFCTELIKEMALSDEVSMLTMYLAELTLLDGEPFLKYLPSLIATSCFCFASNLVGERCFMPRITEMTGYQFGDLQECVADLFKALHRAPTHPQQAIHTKYSQPKMAYASKVKLPTAVPMEFP